MFLVRRSSGNFREGRSKMVWVANPDVEFSFVNVWKNFADDLVLY
jgi:hypothetical protein